MFRVHMHLEFIRLSYWWSKFIDHIISVCHNELDHHLLKHVWFGVLPTLLKMEDGYNEHTKGQKNRVLVQGLVAFYKNHFLRIVFLQIRTKLQGTCAFVFLKQT